MPRPRSTLFPYTTLFRSVYDVVIREFLALQLSSIGNSHARAVGVHGRLLMRIFRSEERFSRNAETEIYTLSLHDALPICLRCCYTRVPCLAIVEHWQLPRPSRRSTWPPSDEDFQIGRAVQQECRDRDLHSFPTRRSSDLSTMLLYESSLPCNCRALATPTPEPSEYMAAF